MSFFFQAEDGIRDYKVTGVQTCALPISSAFAVIAPGDASVGVAVRCPSCAAVSVNLVSRQHVDIPFWNDARVGVVEHTFEPDALQALDEFRVQLASAEFDERRLHLER